MLKLKGIYAKNLFIVKYVCKYYKSYLIASLLISVSSILTPISDVLAPKYIIDFLQQKKPFTCIVFIILGIFFIEAVKSLYYSWYNGYLAPKAQNAIINGINGELMEKAATLDLKCYEDSEFYNKYTRALKEADYRAIAVISSLKDFSLSLVYIATLFTIIVFMDPVLLLIALFSMLIPTVFSILLGKIQYKYDKKLTAYEKYTYYVKRVFYEAQYSKEIRIFPLNSLFIKKYNNNSTEMDSILAKKGRKIFLLSTLNDLMGFSIDIVFLMIYLAWKIYNGLLSLGDFTALYLACRQLSSRLESFSSSLSKFYEHSLYIDNLKEVLDYKNEIKWNDEAVIDEIKSISINNLCFAYNENKVLQSVNISVKKGEKISIVGINGAGKSTIIKLLLRLYEAQSGEININDKSIKDISKEDLRNHIGLVFQDFQLYAATIAENILLHEIVDKKDEDTVWEALKRVGLYEKVKKFPKDINTLVSKEFSNDGTFFSGGEGQKLALARIFVKNYDVIVLDEPSSALDPLSEKQMYENIMSIAKDKIVIFITHRLTSTMLADRIYLLSNGKIIEEGRHKELMLLEGYYKKMFDAQSEYYIDEQN